MNKLLLLIFLSVILLPGTSSAQWVHQQSGVSTTEWRNVEFLNENTGFICGYNTILKTTNGGTNWINKTIPLSFNLYDLFIVDSNIIYCVGFYGRILKSTNGGDNWINLYNDTLTYPKSVHFVNKDTGWIAGTRSLPNYSFLVKTTDGGATFSSQAFGNIAIWDVYFKNSNTGILVATALIYRTTNGGINWYQPNYNFYGNGYEFNRIGVVNDQYCWIASRTRPVYRSNDFGENWDSIASIPSGGLNVNSTFFINENIGWVGVDFGKVYKTNDGGFNWLECSTPQPSGFISDIFFINGNTGWAVEGNNGNIFKTTTGGCNTVNIVMNNNQLPERNKLKQNYPNPFNPTTTIKFDIPKKEFVTLKVYDISGREVAILLNNFKNAGSYIAEFDASHLSSGVYFYTIKAGSFEETKRMVLIK
mgnify:CR=1 FL=1